MKNIIRKISVFSVLFVLAACNGKVTFSELSASGYEQRYTKAQLAYLERENYHDTTPYNGNMSESAPKPVKLSFKASSGKKFNINLYDSPECNEDSLITTYEVKDKSFDFYNTEQGKSYYWTASYKNSVSGVNSFTTQKQYGPRNLYIEGVENVRDLGGWDRTIKQGLIYRSGRFNEDKADPVNVTISENGINELNNHLKIKTEIDLRRTSTNEVGSLTNKSVLGDNVKYIQLPMAYGGNNILTFQGQLPNDDYEYDNPAMIKEFFEILEKEENYPIVFHCSIGKDRTGCLAYLVEGLLGFDQETMYRDYMFTNFANAGMCKTTDLSDKYAADLDDYHGDTLQEKVYNYLHEIVDVTNETLDSVIDILSEQTSDN